MKQWKSSVIKIWPANCFYHCFCCTPWNKEHLESRPLLHFQLVPGLWFVVAILSRCEKTVASPTTSNFQRPLQGFHYTATATLKWTVSSQTLRCIFFVELKAFFCPWLCRANPVFSTGSWATGLGQAPMWWNGRADGCKPFLNHSSGTTSLLKPIWSKDLTRRCIFIDLELTHRDIWD